MSGIPNNGLVTIQFQADRSNVDSVIAEWRKGFTIPVKFDYVGPAGPGGAGAPPAASVAGSNGPATFGNLSGAPVYGTGPGGAFMGGPASGITSMSVASMSYGFTSAAYQGPSTSNGAVSNQAAAEIKNAASTFSAAVAQLVGASKVGPSASGAGPMLLGPGGEADASTDYGAAGRGASSARRGMGPFGLARYGMPIVATDIALQAIGAGRQYRQAVSAAAGDPRGMAGAELGLFDRMSNFSFFGLPVGQAFATMVDPFGTERAGIQGTLDQAGVMDAIGAGRWDMGQKLLGMRDQATIANSRGYTRTDNEIAAQHRVQLQNIKTWRDEQTSKILELGRSEVQSIMDKYAPEMSLENLPWTDMSDLRGKRQGELDEQSRTQADRLKRLEPIYQQLKDAADSTAKGQTAENRRKLGLARSVLAYQREADLARAHGYEGPAKEAEFWAAGDMQIFNADPLVAGEVRRDVAASRAGHNAALRLDLNYERSMNQAISQRLEYKGYEASITEIRAQTERQVHESGRTGEEQSIIRTRGAGREALATQEARDRYIASAGPLAIQNQSARIQLGATSPQMGGALAAINNIAQASVFQGYETMHRQDLQPDDRQQLAKSQLEHGRLQMQEFRQEFYRSNQPRQIQSIGQQALNGVGTANTGQINAAMEKQTAILQHLMSHTNEIAGAIRELVRSMQ